MRHGVFFLLFYRHVFHPLLKCSPPLSPPLSAAKASLKKDTTHKCVISIIYVYGHFSSLLHIIKHIKTGLLLHQKNIIWALSSLSLSICSSLCVSPLTPPPPAVITATLLIFSPHSRTLPPVRSAGLCSHAVVVLLLRDHMIHFP